MIVLLRTNEEGRHYGITFIDTRNKSVFNGSEIGKEYSIASLQKMVQFPTLPEGKEPLQIPSQKAKANQSDFIEKKPGISSQGKAAVASVLRDLLTPEMNGENIPAPLLQRKGKRKKKRKQS